MKQQSLQFKGFHYSPDLYFNGFPSSVSIEVTNKCNLRCMHCHHTYRTKMKTGDLLEGVFEKLVPHLGREIRHVSLNGLGEPLLSSRWETVLDTCLGTAGLNVGFITNGIMALDLKESLFLEGRTITFSIDGASPATYRLVRNADSFDRVIMNVKRVRDEKRRRGSSSPVLGAIYVVTAENMHEMPDFVKLSGEIGIENVSFTHLVAHFESQLLDDSAFFRRQEHDRYLAEAQKTAAELGVNLVHMGSFDKSLPHSDSARYTWLYRDGTGDVRCGFIKDWCLVNYTGHVQVCCAPESLIAGDLREDGLRDIWNGSVYRKLKAGLAESFEKTCGELCNLRQTIGLDDVRGFYCPIRETYDYDPGLVIGQPYRISDLSGKYVTACEALRTGRYDAVLGICHDILEIEPLSFEAENLAAIALAVTGRREEAAARLLRALNTKRDYRPAADNLTCLFRKAAV